MQTEIKTCTYSWRVDSYTAHLSGEDHYDAMLLQVTLFHISNGQRLTANSNAPSEWRSTTTSSLLRMSIFQHLGLENEPFGLREQNVAQTNPLEAAWKPYRRFRGTWAVQGSTRLEEAPAAGDVPSQVELLSADSEGVRSRADPFFRNFRSFLHPYGRTHRLRYSERTGTLTRGCKRRWSVGVLRDTRGSATFMHGILMYGNRYLFMVVFHLSHGSISTSRICLFIDIPPLLWVSIKSIDISPHP